MDRKVYDKTYREKHREQRNSYQKEYYEKNKEERAKYKKEWYKRKKAEIKGSREEKVSIGARISKSDYEEIKKRLEAEGSNLTDFIKSAITEYISVKRMM